MAYSISRECVGCTLCAKNCPVQAITGELKQLHTINPERCVECGVCANFCNKQAVLAPNGQPAEKLPKEQWKKPVFKTDECSACQLCVAVCRKELIRISLPKFKGDTKVWAELTDEAKCVGCARCEQACPLHVITMKGGEAK